MIHIVPPVRKNDAETIYQLTLVLNAIVQQANNGYNTNYANVVSD